MTPGAMPLLGYPVMMYQTKKEVDASELSDETASLNMTVKEEYGFVFRFALLSRYNSDTASRVGSVLKINGLTS
jgi:hypothetical protein